jgi:hypothetical protein
VINLECLIGNRRENIMLGGDQQQRVAVLLDSIENNKIEWVRTIIDRGIIDLDEELTCDKLVKLYQQSVN